MTEHIEDTAQLCSQHVTSPELAMGQDVAPGVWEGHMPPMVTTCAKCSALVAPTWPCLLM